MPPLEQIPQTQLRNYINGVIRQTEVSNFLLPEGAVQEAINVHFDSKGAVTLRKGMSALGNQIVAGKPILGIHNFLDSTGTYNKLLCAVSDGTNNDIYYLNGSTWTKTLEDDTKDKKTRFYTFANREVRVNGTDALKAWSGTGSWEVTGGPLAVDIAPVGTVVGSLYRKLYIGNAAGRLYYSSDIAGDGTVTWFTAGTGASTTSANWVDINPNDGDNFTALQRYGKELLVFKKNYLYRWLGVSGGDADSLISVGTYGQESVIVTKSGVMFYHPSGFYIYAGGQPTDVSRPISEFVKNISYANYANVAGWEEADGDHACFSVGNITIGGAVFTNVICRYTLSSQVWTLYSTDSQIRCATRYLSGTEDLRVLGNSDGYILKWNDGYTDNGSPINYDLITKYYEIGSLAQQFTITKLAAVCQKAQKSFLAWQVNDETAWHPIGQLLKYLTVFGSDKVNIKGHRVRFKLFGTSSSEPFIFEGIEILSGIKEGEVN